MKHCGYWYVLALMVLDLLLPPFGWVLAAASVLSLLTGDWISQKQNGALPVASCADPQRNKLERCFACVLNQAQPDLLPFGQKVSVCVIPEQTINAYCLGFRTIAVTQGTLGLDRRTLQALLAHEFGHLIHGDSVFFRVLMVQAMGLAACLFFWQGILLAVMILLFLLSLFCSAFRLGYVSCTLFRGLTGLVQSLGLTLRHALLAAASLLICFLGRRSELRADAYAAHLGYADPLCRFLERFSQPAPQTFREMLHGTHPDPGRRIQALRRQQPPVF